MKNDKHFYSFREIVQSLPKKKNSKSSLWVKTIVRKLSFVFTYLFVNLGITPWTASVISAFVAAAGSILFAIDSNVCRIIGLVCIQLWLVLDCVDGNIARVTKHCSDMGDFIDTLSGYIVSAGAMLGIGIAAKNTTSFEIFQGTSLLIIMGALGSIGNVLARLIHQNYMVTLLRIEAKGESNLDNPDSDVDSERGLSYIRSRVDKELGISGVFMPLLIIAFVFGYLDIFTILYGTFFIASAIMVAFYYGAKSKG